MQRQSIKHGERLFERSLDIQRNSAEAFLENSFAIQRNAQRQSAELTKDLFEAQFDAFQSALDDEVRSVVNRQLEDQTIESVQQTRDAAQETAENATDAAGQQLDGNGAVTEQRLEELDGLGPTYANRLREYGIESYTHLAQPNPETIAQAADVSESQAEQWSERAKSQA